MSRRPYSYSVLRYVHDVVTGEFVNVGVVLLAPAKGDLRPIVRFEFKDRIQRLRSLFPDVDRLAFAQAIGAVRRAARAVAKDIEGDSLFVDGDARTVAVRMLPHDGSSLQWSPIGTGLSKDVEKDFRRIANRMLSHYDKRGKAKRSDDDVWRPVRAAIVERKIGIEFESKIVRGEIDAIEFTHSWKNGKIHAYEPLSFDLADADNIKDKARRWFGHLGAVGTGAHEEFQAHFIVGKPSDPRLLASYEAAVKILRSAVGSPEVYEEEQISDLVDKLEDSYRHHMRA